MHSPTNSTFSVVVSIKNRWHGPCLATDSSLKFPCCRLVTNEQYFTSSGVTNHVIAANQPLHLLRLFYDIVVKVTFSVFQPAMSKKRTILDQRIEVLRRLGEAHRVECLLPSQCGKTQMAPMLSKQTGLPSWPTFNTSICVLYNTRCCLNFRFTNHSIHYDNACIQYEYRWW